MHKTISVPVREDTNQGGFDFTAPVRVLTTAPVRVFNTAPVRVLTNRNFIILALFIACSSFIILQQPRKPIFFIIGDSTVRNGDGTGKGGLWGWGSVIAPYFDTTKISVRNEALGGRSSRTFITEGHWDKVLAA